MLGCSGEAEQGREHDHHRRQPQHVDGCVGGLPSLKGRERAAPLPEAEVEPGGPSQVRQQHQVLAESRDAVGGGAEVGQPSHDGAQHQKVDQQGGRHQQELQQVEQAAGGVRVSGGHRVDDQRQHQGQQHVEEDQHAPADVDPSPGEGHGHQERDQHGGEQWREEPCEHRRDPLQHALSRLGQPGGHDGRTGCSARQHPEADELADVDPDGGEDPGGGAGQHSAAERDQTEVDDPLAGEAHEVHALGVGPPVAAGVSQPDGQPQQDGQVQRGQHLCVRRVPPAVERVDVDDHRGCGERPGQQAQHEPAEPALPGEVAGQEREHQQADVAGVELAVVLEMHTEDLGRLDGHGCAAGQRAHHRELAADLGTRGVGCQAQPLPESSGRVRCGVGLLARFGLGGAVEGCQRRIECAGSLGSYQERLVGFQPRVCEPDQMLPQPALQPFVAGPVAPVADEGFESVVDARKLLAASQPLVGPAPWPWC